MSFAESHAAGGEGSEEGSGGDGEGISHVNGDGGLLSGLSLSVIDDEANNCLDLVRPLLPIPFT